MKCTSHSVPLGGDNMLPQWARQDDRESVNEYNRVFDCCDPFNLLPFYMCSCNKFPSTDFYEEVKVRTDNIWWMFEWRDLLLYLFDCVSLRCPAVSKSYMGFCDLKKKHICGVFSWSVVLDMTTVFVSIALQFLEWITTTTNERVETELFVLLSTFELNLI